MRKVNLNGVKMPLSKSEFMYVKHLQLLSEMNKQIAFDNWYLSSPTAAAVTRRAAVGAALGLNLPPPQVKSDVAN